MLEVLQFVFQSFWHWLGATVMLIIVASIPVEIIGLFKKDK
jgi:hypothetical protein